MLIDTHAHINLLIANFDTPLTSHDLDNLDVIVQEFEQKEIFRVINVGTNFVESNNSIVLANKFSSIFAAIGIHPTDWHPNYKKDLAIFNRLLKEHEKIVAIGECGLDLYHKQIPLEKQIPLFHAQIEIALTHKKPLIIHSRDAYDQTLKILEIYRNEPLNGTIHCFSYDYDFAQTVIDWHFVVGIGGTITYPNNAAVRDAAQKVPLSSIVLETDAPFLPIQSMRGKKNHPQYIVEIAQYLADLRTTSFGIIATETTKTAKKLFGLE